MDNKNNNGTYDVYANGLLFESCQGHYLQYLSKMILIFLLTRS